jgi:hypothetical protein
MTEDVAEVAEPEPELFLAVTTASSTSPTSAEPSLYDDFVAPLMFEHTPLLQSRHW